MSTFTPRKKTIQGMHFVPTPAGGYALVPVTEDQVKNADRSRLSISVAHAVEQCPASHLAKNNLPRREDPFDANVLGSGSHDILEHVFTLPNRQRTEDEFRRIAREVADRVWAEEKLADEFPLTLEANRELKAKWHDTTETWALRLLLLENPQEVDVIGTELEFAGEKTSNGVVSTGKIDRLDRLPDGSVRIVDYKFGVWKGEPNPKFKDGYKEQGYLYLDLTETNLKEKVSDVQILYPREPHRRIIQINRNEVATTLEGFKATRKRLTSLVQDKKFPAVPSALCGWCDIARACPVAKIPRMEDAKGTRWKTLDEALESARKANRSACSKRTSQVLNIHVLDALGNDLGVVDDTRFTRFAEQDAAERKAEEESAAAKGEIEAPAADPVPGTETAAPVQADLPHETVLAEPRITEVNTPATSLEGVTPMNQVQVRPEARMDQEMAGDVLNLNSTAARNALDLTEFALWTLRDADQLLGTATLSAYTRVLAATVRRVQYQASGTCTLQNGAGSRALHAVKSAARTIPAPFGMNEQAWLGWSKRIEFLAEQLMKVSESLTEERSLDYTGIDPADSNHVVNTLVSAAHAFAPAPPQPEAAPQAAPAAA